MSITTIKRRIRKTLIKVCNLNNDAVLHLLTILEKIYVLVTEDN